MFDKFGEFDSVEELNRAAKAQKEEGDIDALIALAIENGLDREDALEYADDMCEYLATDFTAAAGKLRMEAEAMELKGLFEDWTNMLIDACTESGELCAGVRKKGRRLAEALGAVLKAGFETKTPVPKDICKAAGLSSNVYIGMPSKADIRRIMNEYYGGAK